MRKYLILQLLFLTTLAQANIYWQRLVSNYNRHDYMAANQNWYISQNANGWMYFANDKGLLEFDGVYWNTYAFGHNVKPRALMAEDSVVYVGGLGEFGQFMPNSSGKLEYKCLSNNYKEKRSINVWKIHRIGHSVYFQGNDAVYVHGEKPVRIPSPESIHYSTVANNRLLIATKSGLYQLAGGKFQKLPGTEELTRSNVVGIFQYFDKLLVVTSTNGLYLYDYNSAKPFETNGDDIIRNVTLNCAALSGSKIALGTVQNGIIIIDFEREYVNNISMHKGLQSNSVLSLAYDRDHNLWIGLDNGIDYLPLNSPVFYLLGSSSHIGLGYVSCAYNNSMYFGTNQGIYTAQLPMNPNSDIETTMIPGSDGVAHCMYMYDNRLFCGGRKYFFMIDGNGKTTFNLRGVWNVRPVHTHQAGDVLLLGTYWGLYVMKRVDGTWKLSHQVANCDISAKTMYVEDGTNCVWVANKAKGLYRLTLSPDLKRVVNTKNYNSEALPMGDNVTVNKVDGEVVVATRQGLFRYDVTDDVLKEYSSLEALADGKVPYTYLWQDGERNIWYVHDNMLRLLRFNKSKNAYDKNSVGTFLYDNLVEDFEHVNIMGDRAFIGTEDGFAMLLHNRNFHKNLPMTVQIRKIYANGDSLMYESSLKPSEKELRIAHKLNSLRIEFSSSCYDRSRAVLYSYRLLGDGDEEWSKYSPNHVKEYTHLAEGTYTFCVRAMVDGQSQPSEATLEFVVLPPWYRTWWAYLLYLIAVGAAGYYVFCFFRDKRRQELDAKDQQMQMMEQHYKSEAELQEQNELITARMNVMRKNEMLAEIKKTAQSINNSLYEENLPSVKRKVVRLISQINTNMEHDDDLKAFQGSFDAVHRNFFSVLEARFPELSYKDKVLCAYLKMNLLSKEIAPLMNISVRGVEISRYRLRRKLNLGEGVNLSEFLQRITIDAPQE